VLKEKIKREGVVRDKKEIGILIFPATAKKKIDSKKKEL
jgi:hypothetical protein